MSKYNIVRAWAVFVVMQMSVAALGQELAVKTNLLSDAVTVPSIGGEYAIARRWTLHAEIEWMPLYQSRNHYVRTLKLQPEARFWFRAPFTGPFVGPSVQMRFFNMGGLPVFKLRDERIQGHFWSVGATVGWHFTLSARWGLEPALTLGYGYADFRRYAEPRSRIVARKGYIHYFGPTSASVNLVYMLH